MAEYLREGHPAAGYLGLRGTIQFEESDLQSDLSQRLRTVVEDACRAEYFVVADYCQQGSLHAIRFRNFAIHSPAQRRKMRTWYCNGGDIREARAREEFIQWLDVSNEQIYELQDIWRTYTEMDGPFLGASEWINKARWKVFTPEQHALWNRMGEEDGPPPEPPRLSSSEMVTVDELESLSPVFKAVRTHTPLDLSDSQKEFFAAFSDVVRTALPWIEQFDYPNLFFPKDPGFAEEDPIGKTTAEAMFHADQVVLLKILTPEQYDQLVPGIVGDRDEFPRLKFPTAR